MKFNERFSALLALSSVKGISLAKAINIDSAQISRFRTGVRKMPSNKTILHDISDYLSSYFENSYRITGLYELTGDASLLTDVSQQKISEIIYTYLSSEDTPSPNNEMHNFLDRLNNYLPDSTGKSNESATVNSYSFEQTNLVSYHGNDGKRQALLDFFSFLVAKNTPCTVHFFSDESNAWFLEDGKFTEEFDLRIKKMAENGCKFVRVQPPAQNIERSFQDIERWLPIYMTGALKMFFYPWARDELHRRSIVVVQNMIAFYSASLYGMNEAEVTFISTECGITNSFNAYFNDIVRRCQSVVSVYTLTQKEEILSRIVGISQIADNGIYKSHCLSAHTIPREVHESMRQRAPLLLTKVLDCYEKADANKKDVIMHFTITDILSLPDYRDVCAGIEPIPGTISNNQPLYYTPTEYVLHLESIIHYLEIYPNYRVVLLDSSGLDNVVIYTKGNHHVLLVKESDPFALLEVTERTFAASLVSYLNTLSTDKYGMTSREDILKRLHREIEQIQANREQVIS